METKLVFEDLNRYNGVHTEFPFCNEQLGMWNKALDGIEVDNAASICSGGEVTFFSILPRVKEKLVAIDHSYRSMYYAIAKYHVVEKLGAVKAHALFKEPRKNKAKLLKLAAEANKDLPTNGAIRTKDSFGYSPEDECWEYDSRILESITQKELSAFKRSRAKLHFLHGDLTDLVERGPFDLVYLSNAMQYAGRDKHKNYPVEAMVKPGGYICYTGHPSYYDKGVNVLRKWETLFAEYPAYGYSYGIRWQYTVKRAPA